MPLQSYATLLTNAQKETYAVGAFNIFSIEFLHPILEAAEEERSPVVIQIAPKHFKYVDLAPFVAYVRTQIDAVSVPACLNLDHGTSKEIVMQGIRAGFTSVMYDGSRLPFEDNVSRTREIVELCHAIDIPVEGELGRLNDEGVEINEETADRLFTDPEKAAVFASKTTVDSLAVSIGNAHGFYKSEPRLDFDRLQQLGEAVPVPLVLHGGSGISDPDFQKAISMGICKINIYTEMSEAALGSARANLAEKDSCPEYAVLLEHSREAVKQVVKKRMRVFGSSGKAPL